MSSTAFEEKLIQLAHLLSEPPSLKKEEKDDEEQAGFSEQYPGTFSKDDSEEETPRRSRIVRKIEKLGRSRQDEVVTVLKRLKKDGCSFRFCRSGSSKFVWISKPEGEEKIRVSVPAPEGFEKLMWKAGIRPERM